MAFFIGGQLGVAVAVVPVETRLPDRERLRAIARRFGYGSLVALGVLIATGTAMAMAIHFDYWSNGTLQIKLGLVGFVVALTTLHLLWPRARWLQAVILIASWAIVWLGLELAH